MESIVPAGNRWAPVEQVVEPKFKLLNVAVVGGERIASKDWGRGWNAKTPVAQSDVIVLHLHRPIRHEHPFDASAHQPAAIVVAAAVEVAAGDGHPRSEIGDGHVVVADPAGADLAVEQQVIEGCIAKAGSQCRDNVIVAGDDKTTACRSGDRGTTAAVGSPVEVPFAADDEPADLVIKAELPAADEDPAVVIEVRQEQRVGPVVSGPGTANVGANVESSPKEHGRRQRGRWQRRDGQ